MTSYCTICDTATRPCASHPGTARYLDPIVYVRAEGNGWKAPEAEREDWQRRPLPIEKARRFDAEARPLQQLLVELEAWLFLSNRLEADVRSAYAVNALRTTRLVEKVVVGAQEQTLGNAAGYLAKHVADIATRRQLVEAGGGS